MGDYGLVIAFLLALLVYSVGRAANAIKKQTEALGEMHEENVKKLDKLIACLDPKDGSTDYQVTLKQVCNVISNMASTNNENLKELNGYVISNNLLLEQIRKEINTVNTNITTR